MLFIPPDQAFHLEFNQFAQLTCLTLIIFKMLLRVLNDILKDPIDIPDAIQFLIKRRFRGL